MYRERSSWCPYMKLGFAMEGHHLPDRHQVVHAAIKGLNRLGREHRVRLRQSYLRIAKQAAKMAGRYAHAK
jgi:hypothetical protein